MVDFEVVFYVVFFGLRYLRFFRGAGCAVLVSVLFVINFYEVI